MGDFNIDTLREKNQKQSYLDTITSNGFELLIKCPNRVSDTFETCTDRVITRNLEILTINVLDDDCFSDHYPIILKTIFGLKTELSNYTYRDMSFLTKEDTLKYFLLIMKQKYEFSNLISDHERNSAHKNFKHGLLKSFNILVPTGKIVKKSNTHAPCFIKS